MCVGEWWRSIILTAMATLSWTTWWRMAPTVGIDPLLARDSNGTRTDVGSLSVVAVTHTPFGTLFSDRANAKASFHVEPIDWVLAFALAFGQYAVLDLYRDFYNPENQAIGHDNYAFLSTAVAAQSGEWDLYMVDKRPLYGILSALIAPFFGGDTIRATVAVSMGAMSLVQVPMFLLGRLWGGKMAGFAAGLMLLGTALFYPYAHEVSSYPLYNLVATSTVLAVSWALFHPSARSFLLAGMVMAVLTLTQVKNFVQHPHGDLACDVSGRGWKRLTNQAHPRHAWTVGAALGILFTYPVKFTPLVLIMHHREGSTTSYTNGGDNTALIAVAFPTVALSTQRSAGRWVRPFRASC